MVIGCRIKAQLAIITSLNDMLQMTGKLYTWAPGHHHSLDAIKSTQADKAGLSVTAES